MTLIAALALSYLLGAIPTSWLVGRFAGGIDLREHGSKNLGATNLYRTLGWKYAVPVGLFDVAKGAFPVSVLAPHVSANGWGPSGIAVLLGAGAILGHVFSVFVQFRGGKGVATAAGVALALAPLPVVVSAGIWAAVVRVTGYVSLGSMTAAVAFPILAWVMIPERGWVADIGIVLAVFILYTHRGNIRRLLAGDESRFGRRGKAS